MVLTRLGDGFMLCQSEAEFREDLLSGTEDAADRGGIDPLSADDLERLFEICARKGKVVGVEKGNEIIMTGDSPSIGSVPRGFSVNRLQMLQTYERVCGMDTAESGFIDYSYKAVKTVTSEERSWVEQASHLLTIPLF